MCGRYTLTVRGDELLEELDLLELPPDFHPRFNIAPSQPVPVVTNRAPRRVAMFRWGLVPHWAKDVRIGYRTINARRESLADKPAFRDAYRRRRCLVLADGFYEWKALERGKQPYYARLASRRPFGFAGLWEGWRSPEGERILSCTIVTTDAAGPLAEIHHRMPVVVPRELRAAWLAPEPRTPRELTSLLDGTPTDAFEVFPVSTLVNAPANDLPECVVPLEGP